jgi:hypothetical protein
MRIAAIIIAAALLLGGCNVVTSTKPLFAAADAQGQAQLRPGVWANERAGCKFDDTRPMDTWPDCADRWVVRPAAVLAARDNALPRDQWTLYSYLLVRGDPAILQIAASDPGGAATTYLYAGLRPLKRDGGGRVVEYKAWLAQCGPTPPADPSGKNDPLTTTQPLEGLVMDPAKHDCIASAPGPVRESVRLSEAWLGTDQEGRDRARWVRDGER